MPRRVACALIALIALSALWVPSSGAEAQAACASGQDGFGYACGLSPASLRTLPSSATVVHLNPSGPSEAIDLPFTFWFYGVTHTAIWLSAPGDVTFEPNNASSCCRDRGVPDDGIGEVRGDPAFSPGDAVQVATLGNAPNQEVVVAFQGSGSATLQIILHEADSRIEVLFSGAPGEASSRTFGIASPQGESGLRATFAPGGGPAGVTFQAPSHLGIPANLTAVAGSQPGTIDLSWSPPHDTGPSPSRPTRSGEARPRGWKGRSRPWDPT